MTLDAEALTTRLHGSDTRSLGRYAEQATMLEVAGSRLMCVTIRPTRVPARPTAVVVCPSLLEMTVLLESEMTLARYAAEAGFQVSYVQPAGWGDSEGPEDGGLFRDRVAAATAAGRELLSRGSERVCFVGGRVGGTVAVVAAAEFAPDPSIVLWDPVLDVDEYWSQITRLARVTAVRGRRRSFTDPTKEIEERGWTSVLGYKVTAETLNDLQRGVHAASAARVSGPSLCLAMNDRSGSKAVEALPGVTDLVVAQMRVTDRANLGLRKGEEAVEPTIFWMKERLA